jgi:acetyl-CoA/propionyl-CoA/long-chain acyl-CoA carboxylase, biotin carboxylase, biotin carboxyl carrier protein
MFKKLLVANRGEIAVRVMRACRDLGIATVAIYSDLDVEAVHTSYADEAYNVGQGPAAESYLNIEAILQAAKRSGAQAVHPGYGFLAENAGFAQSVAQAGLTWVGPSAEVIDAMGDKVAARRAAADAGVATVPGTPQPVTSSSEVEAFAKEHGLPIAIKASAGGGGKGFRVVADLKDVSEALSGAAREAMAYFSSPDVYLERYLQRPRHIEIQVLGDASGAIVSFPERDCSLQRRHQKLIEESPSPALEPQVREAIMEAAAKVSKQVGYKNAGTCEFLLDADGRTFYFLEMNTRLQVEHPVTEFVTDTDLVVAQLLIAAGEPLTFSQDDIELRGHAIECRINAESPARGFMPSPGPISSYREPGGPGVRVDSGMAPGGSVSQAYDPLISKLITFGAEREQARRRMLRALGEYTIEGIDTSIPFHQLMLADDRFVHGDYHTGTVEKELDLSSLTPVAGGDASAEEETAQRHLDMELDGKRFEVTVREHLATARARKPKPPRRSGGAGGAGGETLLAPMQGTIVKVLVEEGDLVKAGDSVCVLEAMKMENSILAHAEGKVEELKVKAGQSVEAGATLAVIR